jgi:polysaccharide export outer membrane protein
LFSCASRKDFYYQNIDETSAQEKSNSYEVKLQPDDLLLLLFLQKILKLLFNLRSISIEDAKSGLYNGGQQSNQLYLVDANGTIDFPVLEN